MRSLRISSWTLLGLVIGAGVDFVMGIAYAMDFCRNPEFLSSVSSLLFWMYFFYAGWRWLKHGIPRSREATAGIWLGVELGLPIAAAVVFPLRFFIWAAALASVLSIALVLRAGRIEVKEVVPPKQLLLFGK